jgi:hypothetical protein
MLRGLLAQKARIQSRRNTIFPRTPWHGLPHAIPRRPAPPSHAPVGDRRRQ